VRKRLLAVAVAAVGTAILVVPPARGQEGGAPPQRTVDEVVAKVQEFYEATTDYQADFHQTYFHRLFNKLQRSSGRVFFKKPGRMRWEYDHPERKLFVSDGDTLWVFEPEAQQAFRQSLADSQLPTAITFLAGGGDLRRDFRPRLIPSAPQGFPRGYVLELRPRRPSPAFERLLFFVDASSFQVVRTLVLDSAGNRNRMDFSAVHLNTSVPEARFHFTPPRGTRIIDP